MRDDRPSLTAIYIALARALASADPELSRACRDPYAEVLLPRQFRALLTGARRHGVSGALGRSVRALSLGLEDHVALRTSLIDSAISQAAAGAISQVVLLGAGLDARAHRLESLRSSDVYELDHPATQAMKRRRAAGLPIAARALHYVACDFTRGSLADALAGSAFDATRPTAWVWEGVTMYLSREQVVATLANVSALSAPASWLIMTYLTPDLVSGGARLGRLSEGLLELLAEPIRFSPRFEDLSAMLTPWGFDVVSDAAPREAAPHYNVQVTRPSSFLPKERIMVALKQDIQSS